VTLVEPEWQFAHGPAATRVWQEILRPIARELRLQARPLSEQAVEHMRPLVPSAFTDPTNGEQVRANAESGMQLIADSLERGSDPTSLEPPLTLATGAQARARRGLSLTALMRPFRLVHETLWDWIVAEIHTRATNLEEREAAIVLASNWLFAAVDAIATAYTDIYEAERERWLRSAAAVRTETLEAILAGNETEPVRAGSRLGYELDRNHVGVIAWVDDATEEDALEAGLGELAARTGAEGSLLEPIGRFAVMGWVSRSRPFTAGALRKAAATPLAAGGVQVAMGEPAMGLPGFRRTHLEATQARRVAARLRRPPGTVTPYLRVELIAIATMDEELAQGFVERALGPLVEDDDVSRRLAATLAVYLHENCSRTRAARRLGVHENTISYRVRQAEALLGHPIEDNRLNLGVALALLPAVRTNL
jgi:DNA-binding PucR family transcriptional regulator